jgi:RIO kinase 1
MHKKFSENILDDEEYLTTEIKKNNRNLKKTAQKSAKSKNTPKASTNKNQESQEEALLNQFTYQASRYEEGWLIKSLAEYYENNWIRDINRMVKGGKEASVYLCETLNNNWLAAKVYRPRKFRNLRNDGLYREGRDNLDEDGNIITNAGMLYAMRKKSTYGKHLLHQSWIKHEFNTMRLLYNAGCDIPKPLTSGANSMLMEYIGDEQISAPVLQAITLTPTEAREIGQRVLHNIELMLVNQRIHGDLSPFNILIWHGEIRLIDFPQAIHPNQNPQAFQIFKRDLQKMNEYFQLFGYRMMAENTAESMWQKYKYMQAEDFLYDLPDQFDELEI